MKIASRVTLMLGAGMFALIALSGERTYAQAADPNAYPNPYQLQDRGQATTWSRKVGAPEGRVLASGQSG